MMNQTPSSRRVTCRDIAASVGVSASTVSLALRNHPRIRKVVRDKIKATADHMGYQPDPRLAVLSNCRRNSPTKPAASVMAWISCRKQHGDQKKLKGFDAFWRGANSAAAKLGYRLEEFLINEELSPKSLHQIFKARGIRAVLLPPEETQPDWGDFPWEEYSVVRLGQSLQTPLAHLVASDLVGNTLLAFEKMWEQGYRRIGFITHQPVSGPLGSPYQGGFLLAQSCLPPEVQFPILEWNGSKPKKQQALLGAWLKQYRPDAVLSDFPNIKQKLSALGFVAPKDIGLAMINIHDAEGDSGINQQQEEIGRVAILTLNSLIMNGEKGRPAAFQRILVQGTWVDGSCLTPCMIQSPVSDR